MKVIRKALPTSSHRLIVPSKRSITNDKSPIFNKTNAGRALTTSNWLAYLFLLGLVFVKTPGINNIGNEAAKKLALTPKANKTQSIETSDELANYDSFVRNHRTFSEVLYAINEANIQVKDLSGDGILLNTPEEIDDLIATFKRVQQTSSSSFNYDMAIDLLNEIKLFDQLIFGTNPSPDDLRQNNRPNCQVMAAIQAHYLTPQNFQHLKEMIRVEDYSLDENDFYINFIATRNNEPVRIPFQKLAEWMSPEGIIPSSTLRNDLGIPIYTLLIEEKLTEDFDGTPSANPAAALTLLTGKNYSSISTLALDDRQLENIFKLAPDTPITVGSYSSTRELLKSISDKFFGHNGHEYSPEKAKLFVNITQKKTEEIVFHNSTTTTQATNITPEATLPKADIITNHVFVVKNISYVNGKPLVHFIDSHGIEYKPLSIEQIRDKISVISMPTNKVPPFSNKSLFALLLAIPSGIGIRIGINRLKDKLT